MSVSKTPSLIYTQGVKCTKTRARVGTIQLMDTRPDVPFGTYLPDLVETPTFMPVGTNGTMKAVLPEQVEATGCRLLLCNTYHLGLRPGVDIVKRAGGIHHYMNWPHGILTDSGGFQMVSLSKLMDLTEEGVTFTNPYNKTEEEKMFLPPEESIAIQQGLGSNIMMQLDDVVPALTEDQKRVKEAKDRSTRWLDRCIEKAKESPRQTLFPIIQGGLNEQFRIESRNAICSRNPLALAVGGLSGGEAKIQFIHMVDLSTNTVPDQIPRYCMGVGYALDMMLCVSRGVDLFDCVYPTRTARFGTALVQFGKTVDLTITKYATDIDPIDEDCDCATCTNGFTRGYLHHAFRSDAGNGCQLLTVHNLRFQARFMKMIRDSIKEGHFDQFMLKVIRSDSHFEGDTTVPDHVMSCLQMSGIELNSK